jgi:hypothetical protein
MNTKNNKLITNPQSLYPVMFSLPTVGFIAILIATLSFCSLVLAEIYEVIENGQVYLVETEEVLVAEKKPKTPDELDVEIGEKMEKMNKRLNKLADIAMDEKLDLLTEKQRKHLEKEVERSNRANERLKKSKGFKEMGKKHKFKKDKSGQSEPDFYPDFYVEAVDDDDYDVNALDDLSAMIDDVNILMDETEKELLLLTEVEELKQEVVMLMAAGMNPAEPYTKLQNLMNNSPFTAGFYIGAKAAKITAVISQSVYDYATCTTRQTIGGFNSSSVGVAFAAITGGLEIISEGLQIKVDYDEAQLSDAGYFCIIEIGKEHAQIMSDIEDINGLVLSVQSDANALSSDLYVLTNDVNEVDGKVDQLLIKADTIDTKVDALTGQVADMNQQMNERFDAMTALLNQRFKYIEQLLCTPQGKRPDFPNK